MKKERLFWQVMYRSLLAMAQAIKTTKLNDPPLRQEYVKLDHDPAKAAAFFAAQGCRVKSS
jgi:hypothetical protein